MIRTTFRATTLAALASAFVLASGAAHSQSLATDSATASATPAGKTQVIYDTPAPGGWFGYYGPDLFVEQRVAARFTAPASGDMRLARIGIYFMNNSDTVQAKMRISLQTDALDAGGDATLPSGKIMEKWIARVGTTGWNPAEQFFTTTKGPLLKAGHNYWVVAESLAKPLTNPIWLYASKGLQVSTIGPADLSWYPAAEGGALTLRVDAMPVGK